MDVKSEFLHGEIKQDIYMQKTKGFSEDNSLVCSLNKSLYGLKQAPRAWYAKMDNFLLSLGFERCTSDPNVYFVGKNDHTERGCRVNQCEIYFETFNLLLVNQSISIIMSSFA